MKIRASLLATALACMPFAADAAGLGKITVYSALGQPLRAEVEVSAAKAELSGMVAKLASQDAFQQAGIDYATTLLGIKFAIDQRSGGQAIIRLTSDRPINDPFVDMLVELNWPSGRLVREYTFLLDPPEMSPKSMPQVSTVEAKVPPKGFETRPLAESPATPAVEEKPAKVTKPTKAGKARVSEAAKDTQAKSAAEAGNIEVKRGDTLRKLASENLPEGVSLDQMLVGLFRANKSAFDAGNMNRLRAGRILTVPDKESVAAVSETEARKIVVAQSADWNAYRRKLAGAVAQGPGKEEAGTQAAAGKITAKVEDKVAPAAESKDQVKVSKTETGRGGKPGAGKASEEDRIAKDKALKEANERAAALEKNVGDLQKLAELKNQNMAELQKQAAAKAPAAATAAPTPAPTPATKPAEPAKIAEAANAVEPPKPTEMPKAGEAAPATPVVNEAAKPEAAPVPAPAAEAPKPKPKPKVATPPPEEPSIVDTLLDNPLPLAGGLAALLGLGGLLAYRRRKQVVESNSTLPPPSDTLAQPSLGANSVFKSTGGQSVDTSNTPATDFSQAGPGTIDTDEVDPVAEADVYMAYGRDAQAEEILLEAMQKDPKRFAIHAKLLEIYANRKNVKQFEILASELYAQTGGVGTEWEKVAAMGNKLDPSNPLYSGSSPSAPASAPAPAFDPEATMVVGAGKSIDTFTLPGAHVEEPESVATPPATPQPEASPSVVEPAPLADLTSLDFDLGFGEEPAPAEAAASASELGAAEPEAGHEPEQVSMPNVLDFDLDLGTATPAEVESPTAAPEPAAAMEFHLPEVEDVPAAVPAMEAPAVEENIIDFDLDLGETAQAEAPRAFDLSAINLDLEAAAPTEETVVLPELAEEPAAEIAFEPAPAAAPAVSAPADLAVGALELEGDAQRWQEVATKLDLAKAYEEMGDMEGARELLQEVLTEGNPEQQEKARSLMEKVGS